MQEQGPGVRYGLLAGIIGSIILLLLFFIDHSYIFKPIVYIRPISLIVFMLMAAKEIKDTAEVSFKSVLRPTFLVAVIGNLFVFFCNHMIYNVLDPDLAQKASQYAVDMLEKNSAALNPDMLEETVEQIESYDSTITLMKSISSYCMSLILSFIPAAIIAAIYSKQKR